ncbi:MAG: Imm40 family immunity protein [Planctomycetota bacterium]|jgi:hypothetical protein
MGIEHSWLRLIPSELRNRGRSLTDIGVNSIAWTKTDALEVIKILSESGYKILGGDVINASKEKPCYTYDNWSSDKKTKELDNWDEMVRVSCEVALNYIDKYREGRRKILYDVVSVNSEEYTHLEEKRRELST